MQVHHWKGKEIQQEFSACRTMGDVISEIENRFQSKGEVLCELKINGVRFSEKDESHYAGSLLEELFEVTASSSSVADLVRGAVRSQLEMIPGLKEKCLSTADQLRMIEFGKAQKDLSDILEACRWLTDGLNLIKVRIAGKTLDQIGLDVWERVELDYIRVVREALEAFKSADRILLADVIEYDLSTILERWQEQLLSLEAKLTLEA